jgi:hypothetical protein
MEKSILIFAWNLKGIKRKKIEIEKVGNLVLLNLNSLKMTVMKRMWC